MAKKRPPVQSEPAGRRLLAWVWLAVAGGVAVAALAWWATGARSRADVAAALGALSQASPEVTAAIEEARADVLADPADAGRWGRLGMVCEANGQTGAAHRSYVRATALAPGDARWWYRRALVEARLGEPDAALASIEKASQRNGAYAPIAWRRGSWLLDRGDLDGAAQAFARAAMIAPDDPAGVVGQARVHLARREDAQAAEVLEKLLARVPGDRYALQLLGTAYRRLGRVEEAHYALAAGSTGEPMWADPWTDELAGLRRGFAATLKDATARVLAGDFAGAIPLLERLRGERPNDVNLLNQLGLSYVAAGRSDEGLQLLQQSVDADPENVETHLRMASVLLERQEAERALLHANRAVALSPQLSRAHEARGLALWRVGNRDSAIAAMSAALRYDPRNLQPRIWLGYILMEKGDHATAAGQFEFAARRNPALAAAFVGLGIARVNMGQLDEAEAALTRAATLDPQSRQVGDARRLLEERRSGKTTPPNR